MQKLKDIWAKLEGYWAKAFGWVGAHPKTAVVIIAALAIANLIRKP